jgi:hypothetical protein
MSGYRNLEINGRTWRWKRGKTHLDIRNPEGKGYRPTMAEVKGISDHEFESAAAFGHPAAEIGPGLVRNWIERHAV